VVQKLAVASYHYDNQPTGWNSTKLTPANLGSHLLACSPRPCLTIKSMRLVVPNQQITAGPAPGAYQVVYVATEANTIYAIRASNGAVLPKRTLGTPVSTPIGCNLNGPNVGINSTPVIDVATQTLYVVAYTLMSGLPTYQVFALNLNDLADKIVPVTPLDR
jgi:hypothetical protein